MNFCGKIHFHALGANTSTAHIAALRVEFLLKTDSGYLKDTGVNKPWQPLRIPFAITPNGQLHQSPPSPIPGDLGRGPSHQSHVLKHIYIYFLILRVEFLLKTESGYLRDAEVTLYFDF